MSVSQMAQRRCAAVADSRLLSLAAKRARLRAQADATPVDDPEGDRLIDQLFGTVGEIASVPAHTMEGMLVKARIAVELAEMENDPGLEISISLLRDLERLSAATIG